MFICWFLFWFRENMEERKIHCHFQFNERRQGFIMWSLFSVAATLCIINDIHFSSFLCLLSARVERHPSVCKACGVPDHPPETSEKKGQISQVTQSCFSRSSIILFIFGERDCFSTPIQKAESISSVFVINYLLNVSDFLFVVHFGVTSWRKKN